MRELNFADFADLDNYRGQKQRIIPEGVEKSLIREIKFPAKLIPLRYTRLFIQMNFNFRALRFYPHFHAQNAYDRTANINR